MLMLYEAVCAQSNNYVAHQVCKLIDEKQIMYCIHNPCKLLVFPRGVESVKIRSVQMSKIFSTREEKMTIIFSFITRPIYQNE